jgi:hypothetical protein
VLSPAQRTLFDPNVRRQTNVLLRLDALARQALPCASESPVRVRANGASRKESGSRLDAPACRALPC